MPKFNVLFSVICAELGLCVDHEIASNAIPPVTFEMIQVNVFYNIVSYRGCFFTGPPLKILSLENLGYVNLR